MDILFVTLCFCSACERVHVLLIDTYVMWAGTQGGGVKSCQLGFDFLLIYSEFYPGLLHTTHYYSYKH